MHLTRHTVDGLRRRLARRLRGDDYARPDGGCLLAPEWLVLVINNFCNLRCKMCDVGLREQASPFYAHLVGEHPRNMSLDLLETVLEQAGSFSPRPRIGLAYTEPLIHADILVFCRSIVRRGFFCSITTNGFLLPRLADELAGIGVHEIIVSVDGPEAVHDRIRGREGSFRRLYERVERVNRARERGRRRVPRVRFSYTLTDDNHTCLVDFVRATEALRPTSFSFSHLNFITAEMAAAHNVRWGGAWAVTRSNLGTIDLGTFDAGRMWTALQDLKAYVRSRPALPPVQVVPDLPSPAALDAYYRHPLHFVGGRRCTDPWRMLMVRTDGSVIPAHGRCYNVPVGNVREEPLATLWDGARFRTFRQTLQEAGGTLPACARCCGVIGKPPEREPVQA